MRRNSAKAESGADGVERPAGTGGSRVPAGTSFDCTANSQARYATERSPCIRLARSGASAPSGPETVQRRPAPEASDLVVFATQTVPPAYSRQALLSAFLIVTIFRNRGVGASAMAVTTGRGLKPNFS